MSLNENEAAAIAEIHEQDVAEVRALLCEAIGAEGARWLPMNAIADAMMREIVVLRGRAPCALEPNEQDQASVVCRVIRRS